MHALRQLGLHPTLTPDSGLLLLRNVEPRPAIRTVLAHRHAAIVAYLQYERDHLAAASHAWAAASGSPPGPRRSGRVSKRSERPYPSGSTAE